MYNSIIFYNSRIEWFLEIFKGWIFKIYNLSLTIGTSTGRWCSWWYGVPTSKFVSILSLCIILGGVYYKHYCFLTFFHIIVRLFIINLYSRWPRHRCINLPVHAPVQDFFDFAPRRWVMTCRNDKQDTDKGRNTNKYIFVFHFSLLFLHIYYK